LGKYTDLPDLALLNKISEQDSRALEELYDRYAAILYSLIKKIVPDKRVAEIILVEVIAIVWKKARLFDLGKGSVYTWIITLARNRAIDNVRRTRSSNELLDVYDDKYEDFFIIPLLDEKIDSLDFNTAMNIRPKMVEALDNLTDAQKYVLHLSYYEGYSLDQISDKLKLPIEAVREKIMSAVHNLRENLLGS
jgi:RNA polymerase sigma-70 factor (ECF subfamily)